MPGNRPAINPSDEPLGIVTFDRMGLAHIQLYSSLVPRAKLLAGLFETLT